MLAPGCGGGPSKPSLLLVVVEGVRADHTSAYGYTRQTTPHLESLANEGVVFESAYTSTPGSTAAIASIVSGRFPPEHGAFLRPVLDESVVTLAEALKEAGYATHLVTSDPRLTTESGFLQGFEGVDTVDPFDVEEMDGGAAQVTAHAGSWLDGGWDGSKPFFLMLVYSSTQLPYSPPGNLKTKYQEFDENPTRVETVAEYWTPYARRYNSGELEISGRELAILGGLYDAEIYNADLHAGEVISDLRKRGLLENTLVVWTSERGEDLGEAHHLADESSLRESNLHVPLVMSFPGKLKPGTRIRSLAQDVDLAPTICDLLEVKAPRTVTATAVSHAAPGGGQRDDAISVALRPLPQGVVQLEMSIRDAVHRYEISPAGPVALYDLASDPTGNLNLLDTSPEIAEKLHEALGRWDASLKPLPSASLPPQAAAPAAPPGAGGANAAPKPSTP